MSSFSMKHKNMKMENSVLYFLVMTLVSTFNFFYFSQIFTLKRLS